MTTDELRKLDAEVHRKVMGLAYQEVPGIAPDGSATTVLMVDKIHRVPRYSTDIAAAWLVVEKMASRYHFRLKTEDVAWMAKFGEIDPTDFKNYADWSDGESAPLAIVLAALVAVGGEGEKP